MKDYKREKQFHFKNYILEIPCSNAKMRAKVHHKNLHFQWQRLYEKAIHFIVATNALVRLCIVRHSYTACFLIKTVLCETSNIFLSRTINLNMQEIYLQRYCMKCVPGTHKRKWAINFAK